MGKLAGQFGQGEKTGTDIYPQANFNRRVINNHTSYDVGLTVAASPSDS